MAEVKSNLIELEVVYSKLNKSIDENISRLNAGATAVENYNKKISVIPSEFQKSLVDIKQKTDAVSQSTKSLLQAEKQANQERLKEIQIQKQRENAVDKYNAQLAKEEARISKLNNYYNKTQQQLNIIQAAYNNLAVKKERYNNLTSFEENRLKTLQSLTEKYNGTLKNVDATIGKHTRNVGNYTGTFNPLNNSIAQLGREMPAFANSVQTGFMAISNNLPIFFDAMGNVIAQNKQLQAEGKPTKSVLSQLAAGLFSFQTLLSVGVTLLTLYGKEIVEWATNLSDAEKVLKSVSKAQIEIQSQSAAQAKDLDKYRDVVVDTNISEKERLRALKLLQEQIPELSKVELKHADAIQQVNKYTDYYIKQAAIRYKADGFIKKAGEELIKQEEIRLKLQNKQFDVNFLDRVKALAKYGAEEGAAYKIAAERLTQEFRNSILAQKEYEKSAEVEIKQLDVVNNSRDKKVKLLKVEKDLVFELVDVYSSMFEINKLFLEREIKMYDDLANSENELLEDRIKNFGKYTQKKIDLEILEYNESVRLQNLSYKNEVENLNTTYSEYVKQDNVTKTQRIGAKKELDKALFALSEKHNLDLSILEIKHSNNIVGINKETFEQIAKLQELYGGLGFNKKIKEQELKDLLEHKNRLLNIDKETTKKQLDSIGKDKKDSERKIQEQILQNDIANINKKLENSKLGAEQELKLKTELYEKLKALNNLEIADLEEKRKKQEEYLKLLESTYQGFIDDFSSKTGFGKLFDILDGGLKKYEGDAKATALVISDAFQEAFNTIAASSQANFEAEYERLALQKDISIKFAGEGTAAKQEIERQYEEKRKEIARRQAESDRRLAVFNIIIDTAQAVVAALPNYVLAAVVGVFGAAQAAMVASQPIPAFWKGTDNAPEGWALTQEKGAEVITDKSGNVKTIGNNKGAQMTYLSKGDKVYKSRQDYINKQLVNAGIQPMRSVVDNFAENNSLTTNDFNAGISKLAKSMRENKGKETHVYLNNKRIDTDSLRGIGQKV